MEETFLLQPSSYHAPAIHSPPASSFCSSMSTGIPMSLSAASASSSTATTTPFNSHSLLAFPISSFPPSSNCWDVPMTMNLPTSLSLALPFSLSNPGSGPNTFRGLHDPLNINMNASALQMPSPAAPISSVSAPIQMSANQFINPALTDRDTSTAAVSDNDNTTGTAGTTATLTIAAPQTQSQSSGVDRSTLLLHAHGLPVEHLQNIDSIIQASTAAAASTTASAPSQALTDAFSLFEAKESDSDEIASTIAVNTQMSGGERSDADMSSVSVTANGSGESEMDGDCDGDGSDGSKLSRSKKRKAADGMLAAYETAIECGVLDVDGKRRIVQLYVPFFQAEVEVFCAATDVRRRYLYKASTVAERFKKATNHLGMYLSRRRSSSDGIYQAKDYKCKPEGRHGLKAGGYFLTLAEAIRYGKHVSWYNDKRNKKRDAHANGGGNMNVNVTGNGNGSGHAPDNGDQEVFCADVSQEEEAKAFEGAYPVKYGLHKEQEEKDTAPATSPPTTAITAASSNPALIPLSLDGSRTDAAVDAQTAAAPLSHGLLASHPSFSRSGRVHSDSTVCAAMPSLSLSSSSAPIAVAIAGEEVRRKKSKNRRGSITAKAESSSASSSPAISFYPLAAFNRSETLSMHSFDSAPAAVLAVGSGINSLPAYPFAVANTDSAAHLNAAANSLPLAAASNMPMSAIPPPPPLLAAVSEFTSNALNLQVPSLSFSLSMHSGHSIQHNNATVPALNLSAVHGAAAALPANFHHFDGSSSLPLPPFPASLSVDQLSGLAQMNFLQSNYSSLSAHPNPTMNSANFPAAPPAAPTLPFGLSSYSPLLAFQNSMALASS